ncbi:hypothetical protein [Actinomadura miaoliensis]|uniref:hypothetical protein n=1 Tax=Actinomadura miaoliensis TaxID=430685 RepID=UPI0031EB7C04
MNTQRLITISPRTPTVTRKPRMHQEPDRTEKVIDILAISISFITQHTESATASLPNLPLK